MVELEVKIGKDSYSEQLSRRQVGSWAKGKLALALQLISSTVLRGRLLTLAIRQ